MNAEKPSRDNGSLWLVSPFALAVLGTIVMLFTNSANMLKLSLILALWAAAAGIILTSRLRRDRDEAQRALADSDKRHAAELDAAKARGEIAEPAPNMDNEVLREIQSELKALRTQLEEMAGRQFEYEPAALKAQARRIAEIGGAKAEGGLGRATSAGFETVVPETPPAFSNVTVEATANPVANLAEKKDHDGPSAADTARLQPVREAPEPKRRQSRPFGAPTSDAIAGRLGAQPSERAKEHNPLSQLISERQAEVARGRAEQDKPTFAAPTPPAPPATPATPATPANPAPPARPATPAPARPAPAPPATPVPPAPPAPSPAAGEPRRGRRRRDERGDSAVSVADLLARSSKGSE
ncbi:DUF6779 domain-containing protein [Corynebacterium mayonis]|uniref:DUF6779 domain-containing protein n=1 Tax=Corynebacterium mayonis TaxID=3062461 RepID=UPI0031406616